MILNLRNSQSHNPKSNPFPLMTELPCFYRKKSQDLRPVFFSLQRHLLQVLMITLNNTVGHPVLHNIHICIFILHAALNSCSEFNTSVCCSTDNSPNFQFLQQYFRIFDSRGFKIKITSTARKSHKAALFPCVT